MRSNALLKQDEIADNKAPRPELLKECPRHFRLSFDLRAQVRQTKNDYSYLQADPTLAFIESDEFKSLRLPEGAHGWAAKPRANQVNTVYSVVAATAMRRLHARDGNAHSPDNLNRSGRNLEGLKELGLMQPFDIQVVPVAFGPTEYRNISIEDRRGMRWDYEYPLGLFEGLHILHLNSGRLMSDRDLGIIFAGDCLGSDFTPTVSMTNTQGYRGYLVDSIPTDTADPGFAEATWFMPR